jgi:hypothetical protein
VQQVEAEEPKNVHAPEAAPLVKAENGTNGVHVEA